MGEQKMSVLDVLKVNMGILNQMRIPIGEKQIWEAVQAVMQNELACIEAMEKEQKKQDEEKPENVVEITPEQEG